MIGRLFKLCLLGAAIYCLTLLAVVWFTSSYQNVNTPQKVDVIVCLGAGMFPDGRLGPEAQRRAETCADLYNRDTAPKIIMTGGTSGPGGPAAGDAMATVAIALGVPDAAIIRENQAQSTLQNALFSKEFIRDTDSIMLVTEAFHLPRSYASFRAMGLKNMSLYMSRPVRLDTDGTWHWPILRREALAVWFNAARIGVWYGANALGFDANDNWLH